MKLETRDSRGNFMSVKIIAIAGLATAAWATTAAAAELKKVAEIPIPGEPMVSFDISYIDQKTGRYYLADRSNKSLDIVDAKTNTFIGRVAGFVGPIVVNGKVNNDKSGPDGVVVFDGQAWVGDGDSTVKVVDLKSMRIADVISTGG